MESLFEEIALKRGFRLEYFEFYNWGTFNKQIFTLNMNGDNALLTGEIGSGKSTIVDAITTLFLSPGKIVYNKAAGASAKERSLYSYVTGEYSLSSDEELGVLKPMRLRDHTNYSVLIAKFKNEGLLEEFYIGVFFNVKPNSKEVNRFYFTSRHPISIKTDFLDAKNIKELKKSIKKKCEVFDSYKEYFNSFKRVLGINNIQSIELFYQTVSMKAVGNLTSFIRMHMLEKKDIDKSIDDLVYSFSELKEAHDAVVLAKEQIEALTPIEKLDIQLKRIKDEYNKKSELKENSEAFLPQKS